MEFLQPGTRRRAESSQIHRVDHFLACDGGLHSNRDGQRSQPADARDQSTFEFVYFVTAGALGIHRDGQVAGEGW